MGFEKTERRKNTSSRKRFCELINNLLIWEAHEGSKKKLNLCLIKERIENPSVIVLSGTFTNLSIFSSFRFDEICVSFDFNLAN